MTNDTKKFTFHVSGMHCASCALLVENKLRGIPYVKDVKANLSNLEAYVEGYFGDMSIEEAAEALTKYISENGYRLTPEKRTKKIPWADFKIALPAGLAVILLFVSLQKMGVINLVKVDTVSYGTAFAIGIIASLSSCMAVVGGLLLSMSATFARMGDRFKPQLLFHVGRLVSFFLLGGVIGAIGSAFAISPWWTFVSSLIIGLVMLILGVNLLDTFHFAKKLAPSMPKFISRHILGIQRVNHTLMPFILGVATFFLPCGFTQSMQLYSLTLGSFKGGALTMLSFALGTLPVLALISFGFYGIKNEKTLGIIFKISGIVIIFFAFVNILSSLSAVGLIPPVIYF